MSLQTLIDNYEQMKNEFMQKAQKEFKVYTDEFFKSNPDVKAIIWTQYTPYFNDGEECLFSVNDPAFTNAEGDELDNVDSWGEYEGDDENVWTKSYDSELNASMKEFSRIITSVSMEEIMKSMFGDHVHVIVTTEGFFVNDYEHD